jgi:hypothetical protein
VGSGSAEQPNTKTGFELCVESNGGRGENKARPRRPSRSFFFLGCSDLARDPNHLGANKTEGGRLHRLHAWLVPVVKSFWPD